MPGVPRLADLFDWLEAPSKRYGASNTRRASPNLQHVVWRILLHKQAQTESPPTHIMSSCRSGAPRGECRDRYRERVSVIGVVTLAVRLQAFASYAAIGDIHLVALFSTSSCPGQCTAAERGKEEGYGYRHDRHRTTRVPRIFETLE